MNYSQLIASGFRKIFVLSGRASRAEFVSYALSLVAIWVVIGLVANAIRAQQMMQLLSPVESRGTIPYEVRWQNNLLFLSLLANLAIPVMLFAAIVRRFYDIGRSAWSAVLMYIVPLILFVAPVLLWFLYTIFVPLTSPSEGAVALGYQILGLYLFIAAMLVNFAIFLRLCFAKSRKNSNKYGPNPSEASP